MKIPEGYCPRKGDVVTIQATVRIDADPEDSTIFLRVEGYKDFGVKIDTLASLEFRHWEVGDIADVIGTQMFGEVKAVNGEDIWLQFQSAQIQPGAYQTYHANQLTPRRAPPASVTEEEPK